MPDEIYLTIEDKQKEFAELWGRMDEDKKLLIQDKFTWRDKDDREEPDVDNITLNDAAVFANKVHDTLTRAEILPEVEGEKLKDEQTEIYENFIRDMGLEADANVHYQDIPSYKNFEIMQTCDRGRIARRVTLRVENGTLAPDSFVAIDTRYLIYDYGIKGLNWVAPKMARSADDIEQEYGYRPNSSNAVITDYWNKDVERVYCETELIEEKENPWGEPPFIIEVVPTGVFTFDADRMLYNGESIFAMTRNLYSEKNLFGTILKSLTIKSFFNGLQIEVEDVALAQKPAIPPYGKKFVAPIAKGTKGYFNMPIEDLRNAASMFYSILDSAIQEGSLPKVSYGSLQFPLSAVGMAELKESEDPVYFPRIQGYTLFLQRLYRMILKQYVQFKMHLKLGEPGFRKEYSWKELNQEVSLHFRVDLTSPKENMVNISTAAAVGNLVSDDTKRRDYLHLKNPKEEVTKMLVEKASRMSPAVAKYDIVKALFDRNETVKANLMAAEIGMTLDQILSGQPPPVPTQPLEEEQKPKQLLPMFGGGTSGNNQSGVTSEV